MISEGLICTNENCVACNKCVRACSCPGATIATLSDDGNTIIAVDGSRCVACGACLDACKHNAREFIDDTAAFFRDLAGGEDISLLIAPAFVANYPEEYKLILGKLKALGANRIISVGFGADITTWAYINYIRQNNFVGGISQPCPATVDYIEKYIPELIPKLFPVQSPMMCAAIYARKHMGLTGKLAFISPCIAKKSEIMSKRGKGMISYNVTFDHMMKYLSTVQVDAAPYEDAMECGLGAVYPMPGGLSENIRWFFGEDAFIRQVDGEKKMYRYLEANKGRIVAEDTPYAMLDVLNCSDGCLCGTGVDLKHASVEDILVQMRWIREKSRNKRPDNAWSTELTPEERIEALNAQFSDLCIDDYYCEYEDKSDSCSWKIPTEEELDVVFEDMNKITEADRCVNCSYCGYASCRDMATAIFNGFNHKNNCIHFVKDVLEGISADSPTVILIHRQRKTVHVVKYAGEDAIIGWIESGLGLVDYNTAIRDYIDRYVDEEDKDRLWSCVEFDALLRNLEDTNSYSVNYLRHPENGNTGYFQLNYTCREGQSDIVLAFRDVDQQVREAQRNEESLREAIAEARQANEVKSTFLANMSHEIRTPINAILGMGTMILRESTQENVLEYARNVKSASDTLLSLINDILDFSKIESGKMEIITGNYRLDSVINDLYNMVRGKAEEKGLELLLRVEDNLPVQLCGDEVRIKQIILNLLNNAVKYTKEGSVTFSISSRDISETEVALTIAITDTGIGIRKEDMHILFSPYERIEENKNKLIEGTGLGLSITKDLLHKMNSELTVQSEYGSGSTFSFEIVQKLWGSDRIVHYSSGSSLGSYVESDIERFHAPDAKILVVDDVQMNITVLEGLLKRLKIRPDSCLSGQKAVEAACTTKYDLIFLDAMMPGMDGEETLSQIRSFCPLNAKTPIVVLTADAIIGAREKYIAAGFDDYLSKPIDEIKLEKMIATFLPAELMIPVDAASDEETDHCSEEEDELIGAIDAYPFIHSENGIAAAGDRSVYLTVCRNFCETAPARIEMIREYFDQKDIPNYTIQVHALKSSARLVGADDLSKLALDMEAAGREGNWILIVANTGTLLKGYKEVSEALERVFATDEDTREELPEAKAQRRLSEMLELADAFDLESARELFEDTDRYRLPGAYGAAMKSLRTLMADVDRDGIVELLRDLFGGR